MAFKLMLAAALLVACAAQQGGYSNQDYDYPEHRAAPAARAIGRPVGPPPPKPTPVAILKQINRHNDDGSYTYGFEGADGTFKIETKFANGDVKGKYGFVDDTGKVRTVEYGADRYGFQPSGEGITVAPPTLIDETLTEEPELEYRPQTRVQSRPQPRPQQQARRPQPPSQPQYQAQPQYQPQPQQQYQAQPQQQQYQAQPQHQYQEPKPQQQRQGPIEGANYDQQITYQAQNQYQVQEQPEAPRRQAPRVSAPVPARPLSIPGASPVPARPLSISGASPVPHRSAQVPGSFAFEQPRRTQAPRAGPSAPQRAQPPQQHFQPQPVQQYVQPAPAARAFQAPRQSGPSVLDQLSKEYALPQGGSATHDISFGSTY